jgi:predicted dinucleotide-binding enzyme
LLAQELSAARLPVVVYDPSAEGAHALRECKTVHIANSSLECIAQADVVVLATPWQQFRGIPAAHWARPGRPRVVMDCWRVLNHLDGVDGVDYVRLGFGGKAMRPMETSSSAR